MLKKFFSAVLSLVLLSVVFGSVGYALLWNLTLPDVHMTADGRVTKVLIIENGQERAVSNPENFLKTYHGQYNVIPVPSQ